MSSYAQRSRQQQQQQAQADVPADAAAPVRRNAAGINSVKIDGLVILQLIKHCGEAFPETVAGTLQGLDVDGVLEITHSFPSAASSDGGDGSVYELEMMKALREVGVDNNQVGWYQSTYLGSYVTKDTVQHQFEYQEALPASVLLIYDGVRTAQGQLSIKALRLSDEFCSAYRSRKIGADSLSSLSPSAIFEELPVTIRNPFLIQAALLEMADPGSALSLKPAEIAAAADRRAASSSVAAAVAPGGAASAAGAAASGLGGAVASVTSSDAGAEVDFSRLDLTTGPFLEKHLEFLTDVTDGLLRSQLDVSAVQRRMEGQRRQREEWIARRRVENEARRAAGQEPLPEEDPSLPFFKAFTDSRSKDPLDMLLMSAQISNYASQVNRFAGQSFGKFFLASSLRKAAASAGGSAAAAAAAAGQAQ